MEYLQYLRRGLIQMKNKSFKPYYKWNTFNTSTVKKASTFDKEKVLNLIINGIPSIL